MHHRQIARERVRGGRQEHREAAGVCGGEEGKREREGEREGGRNRNFMYINVFLKKVLLHLVACFTDTEMGGHGLNS